MPQNDTPCHYVCRGVIAVLLDGYERNLDLIATRLKSTGAKVIFQDVTVVPDQEQSLQRSLMVRFCKRLIGLHVRLTHGHGVELLPCTHTARSQWGSHLGRVSADGGTDNPRPDVSLARSGPLDASVFGSRSITLSSCAVPQLDEGRRVLPRGPVRAQMIRPSTGRNATSATQRTFFRVSALLFTTLKIAQISRAKMTKAMRSNKIEPKEILICNWIVTDDKQNTLLIQGAPATFGHDACQCPHPPVDSTGIPVAQRTPKAA